MGGVSFATAKPFLWNEKRLEAARLLGEGEGDYKQVADTLGIDPSTVWRWQRHPAFIERVSASAVESEERAVTRGLGRKGRRVEALSHHVDLLDQIVAERGAEYAVTHPGVPGASTGLLVYEETVLKTTVKSSRRNADIHAEETLLSRKWAVDAALIRERRALLMQISKEVGGIVDRRMNLNVNVDGAIEGEPPKDLGSLSGAIMGRLVPAHDGEGTPGAPGDAVPE